jgi:ethanolamine ammonia-lyase small subunit
VVDGLSGTAVEANALDFIRAFRDGLRLEGLAEPEGASQLLFVRMGRVAIMDQIGELLQPELVVELVGERPGLVTAESMSAYFCYRPNRQSVEADRTLIANIHKGGIPPVEAGAHAARLAGRILAARMSGVKLAL